MQPTFGLVHQRFFRFQRAPRLYHRVLPELLLTLPQPLRDGAPLLQHALKFQTARLHRMENREDNYLAWMEERFFGAANVLLRPIFNRVDRNPRLAGSSRDRKVGRRLTSTTYCHFCDLVDHTLRDKAHFFSI